MELTDKILGNGRYWQWLRRNASCEQDRSFCIHDFQHALDVARVAYLLVLERSLPLEKDLVYATALLHDVAKWKQYEQGTDHAVEGAVLAGQLLAEIGAEPQTRQAIMDAISTHRDAHGTKSSLGAVLYESDKKCRPCVACPEIGRCKRFADGKKPHLDY
jgi:putative nucleotidyltransferase with HDIG domain